MLTIEQIKECIDTLRKDKESDEEDIALKLLQDALIKLTLICNELTKAI